MIGFAPKGLRTCSTSPLHACSGVVPSSPREPLGDWTRVPRRAAAGVCLFLLHLFPGRVGRYRRCPPVDLTSVGRFDRSFAVASVCLGGSPSPRGVRFRSTLSGSTVSGQSGQCRVLPPLPENRTDPDPSARRSRSPIVMVASSLARDTGAR